MNEEQVRRWAKRYMQIRLAASRHRAEAIVDVIDHLMRATSPVSQAHSNQMLAECLARAR